MDNPLEAESHECHLQWEPGWACRWLADNDADLSLHAKVWNNGYPNRWGAKQPVNSAWNLSLFSELLHEYEDKEVVQWLKYGWPTGRLPSLPPPGLCTKNHKGASDYPQYLQKYIKKELQYGAVMGPFRKIPFEGTVGISPLST